MVGIQQTWQLSAGRSKIDRGRDGNEVAMVLTLACRFFEGNDGQKNGPRFQQELTDSKRFRGGSVSHRAELYICCL